MAFKIFGLDVKAIILALALMMVLSIPVGILYAYANELIITEHGLSYVHSDVKEIYAVISQYQYHPAMLLLYVVGSIVSVAIPSYISALMASDHYMLNAMVIGVFSVAFFTFEVGNVVESGFLLLTIVLNMASSFGGGWLLRFNRKNRNSGGRLD